MMMMINNLYKGNYHIKSVYLVFFIYYIFLQFFPIKYVQPIIKLRCISTGAFLSFYVSQINHVVLCLGCMFVQMRFKTSKTQINGTLCLYNSSVQQLRA